MKFSKTDLYNSIATGDTEKAKKILSQGFQMDAKTGEWSLYLAIKNNNLSVASYLLQKGAQIRDIGIQKAESMFLKNAQSKREKDTFQNALKALFPDALDNECVGA